MMKLFTVLTILSMVAAVTPCQDEMSGNSGTLTSPNYPSPYENHMLCTTTVTLDQPGPYTVELTLEFFELENHSTCFYDSLNITGVDTISLCGNLTGQRRTLQVDGDSFTLSFSTDYSVVGGGYQISYNIIPVQECSGNGLAVRQFSGRKEYVKMPCKYNALRQRCGAYDINLTPGNIYVFPKFHLDSLWLGIKEVSGGNTWEGRTDNRLAVKVLNGLKTEVFNKKDGNMETENILIFGKDSTSTWVEATNGDFRVTFVPWDPENTPISMAQWSFECFAGPFSATSYPDQICGGEDKRESVDRMNSLGLKERHQVVYYDVFTNTEITQTNPKCANATRLLTTVCTEQQRREAMLTCTQILNSFKHSKCISKYNCEPMDTFVDCIDWVCSDYQDDFACERVGQDIDLCRTFKDGNLTAKVQAANCYKDFLPIQ